MKIKSQLKLKLASFLHKIKITLLLNKITFYFKILHLLGRIMKTSISFVLFRKLILNKINIFLPYNFLELMQILLFIYCKLLNLITYFCVSGNIYLNLDYLKNQPQIYNNL
jgi:hypothetical protein